VPLPGSFSTTFSPGVLFRVLLPLSWLVGVGALGLLRFIDLCSASLVRGWLSNRLPKARNGGD